MMSHIPMMPGLLICLTSTLMTLCWFLVWGDSRHHWGHRVLFFPYLDMLKNAGSRDRKLQHTVMIGISKLAPLPRRLCGSSRGANFEIPIIAENVDNLVDLALKIMLDPQPRVTYRQAVAFAIKSVRDHHPQYLTLYKNRVTSLMLPLIDSEIHPRVKSHVLNGSFRSSSNKLLLVIMPYQEVYSKEGSLLWNMNFLYACFCEAKCNFDMEMDSASS
ncbi:hypothetical protein Tco_1421334 [Tanacetum coccineum]